VAIPGNTSSVAVDGNHVVLGIIGPPEWSIRTYDITVSTNPQFQGSAYGVYARSVAISGDRVFAQGHKAGLWTYDISNFAQPALIDKFDTEGEANRGLELHNGYLFASDGFGGFNIFTTGESGVSGWKKY
jgi:hypothetical protein